MPKKPRHIQDKVDLLIKEKNVTKEIIEKIEAEGHKVSPSYISTRRKKIQELDNKKETPKTSISPELSKESIRLLYNLQGLLGKENLDDTIMTVSEDYKEIIREKYRYDLDNEKSIKQVFSDFKDAYRIIENIDKNESQLKLLKKMKFDKDPLSYYYWGIEEDDYRESIFTFLSEYAIKYWEEVRRLSITTINEYPFRDDIDPALKAEFLDRS